MYLELPIEAFLEDKTMDDFKKHVFVPVKNEYPNK